MAELIIRPVTIADVVAVRATLIETWHATYDTLYGIDKVRDLTSRWHSVKALVEQVDQADAAFMMAEWDGAVTASSFAQEVEPGLIHLYRLYVHPRAHRCGVGRTLMDATFARFPRAVHYRLEVDPDNAGAIRFYERAGFVLAGRTGTCGNASDIPALVYSKAAV